MQLDYDRRRLLVGAAALLTAGGAFAAEPRRASTDFSRSRLEGLVPAHVGGWAGSLDPDVVPDRVDGSTDRGQTLMRRYLGDGLAPVMLAVSYHGPRSPDLKVHRPETCYAVAGFEGGAPAATQAPLPFGGSVPAVTFTARRAERVETVLYWTRVGGRFPQTLTGQRIDFLAEALTGDQADGLLVRASTIDTDPRVALSTLKSFLAAMVGAASPPGRALLLGAAFRLS